MGSDDVMGSGLKKFRNEIYRVFQITECVNTSERVTDATCYRALQNVTPQPWSGRLFLTQKTIFYWIK